MIMSGKMINEHFRVVCGRAMMLDIKSQSTCLCESHRHLHFYINCQNIYKFINIILFGLNNLHDII